MWAAVDDAGLLCCFIIPFVVVWGTMMAWYLRFFWYAAPKALERWAKEGGYRIVREERRTFLRGPFFWTSSSNQVIYRIEVQHRDGDAKRGWVRIGGVWWPSSDRIEVRWDEPRPAPPDPENEPTRGNPLMWDSELDE